MKKSMQLIACYVVALFGVFQIIQGFQMAADGYGDLYLLAQFALGIALIYGAQRLHPYREQRRRRKQQRREQRKQRRNS